MNYFLKFLFIALFGFLGTAQELNFKNFTQEDGLPSNEVYDVFQDKNGCMWFATDRGIAQYNGYEFKKFEPKDGLTDITVFDFFLQEDETVWCSTFNNKIFYFKNGSNKFHPFKFNASVLAYLQKNKYSTFFVKNIATNSKGEVYLTNNEEVLKIDLKGKITVINPRKIDKDGKVILQQNPRYIQTINVNKIQEVNYCSSKPSSFLQPFYKLAQRNIVGISGQIKLYVTAAFVFFHKKGIPLKKIGFPNYEPIEAGNYDANHFWVSFRGKGAKIFDFNGNETGSFLPYHSVSKIFKDSYGGKWITTIDAGVFYLKENQFKSYTFENSGVNSLSRDSFGSIYVGTFNGDIYKKNSGNSFRKIHKGVLNVPAHVQYFPFKKDVFCFSDNKLFTASGFLNNKIRGVVKISDDNPDVLMLSQFGVYTVYDKNITKSDTLNFRIHDISFVNDKYYLATINGLRVFEKNKVYQKNNKQLNCRIDDLDYIKSKGLFYMASLGKGVLMYNPKTQKIVEINKSKGLSDDLVTEVYLENDSTLWACTNHGLNRIRFKNSDYYEIEYITSSNGLIGNQVKDIEIIKDSIYVGTTKGLTVFSKNQFERLFAKKKYFLRLKKIVVNSIDQMSLNQTIELPYYKNQLDFFLEAVSFSDNKNLFYRYKLEGLDENWHYTKERKVSYEFVPPGKYTFISQVVESGRILSYEKIILPFLINKPFWETWWFISLLILCLAGLLYLFFKIRVLTYNKDIVRELLRLLIKRVKTKDNYFAFRESGKEIRIKTNDILYAKSSGNYTDIVTLYKSYTIRMKISDFKDLITDPLEFLRIHRSYIIRIDKIEQKTKKSVFINGIEIPVGETYLEELDKIIF